ncbi:hypothetical protein [Chryseobacterium culicis]|jgi:hypothetical protein|uniref:Uncharacterized protein n=1 Tax=Chryseobacterium culicis TaxID=680127 RepID=A0A1H6HYV2_CHRCI|nr:hypothetical protein [Chryseobacterium culicis]MBE4950823.1 hypothetical protein [Chryseobacterium culicis]SEH40286.1 hypothetical protein SAMN05421593_3755 [Chryseobacterium culicis]
MKSNSLKIKKASLSRNELRSLKGGKIGNGGGTSIGIGGGGEVECGCVQAGCPGDGSARCGGSCC